MTKRVLEITASVFLCALLVALETRPANSVPIRVPSTESGNEALKNSELESRLKQQSGENKNSDSIQRTTEDGDGQGQGDDGRPAGDPSPEELFAAETGDFVPEEEEGWEEEEEKWKDDDEELEQEPIDDYLDEDRTGNGEQNENFRSATNSVNESRFETEIQNEADESEELEKEEQEQEEQEEIDEERQTGQEEDSENRDYKEFDAPLNAYSNERSQAEYPIERAKKITWINTLNRSVGNLRIDSDDCGVGGRNDAIGYLSPSSVM